MRRLEVTPLYDPPALPGFVVSTDVSVIRVVNLIAVALMLRAPSGPKDATTIVTASFLIAMIKGKTTPQGGWVVPPGGFRG